MFTRAARALRAPYDLWLLILTHLPGEVGVFLRYWHWKRRLKSLGPNVRIGVGVKLQNPAYISIGANCWIDDYVQILAGPDNSARERIIIHNPNFTGEPGTIHIGSNVHVGTLSVLSGISSGIHIHDDCTMSSGCKVYAFSHHYRSNRHPSNRSISFGSMVAHDRQCMIEGPITIGPNTGMALHSVVLPGVHIPRDCFVKIASVVKPGGFPENSVLEGSPAKVVNERYNAKLRSVR